MGKDLYLWKSELKNNKYHELQVSVHLLKISFIICFKLSLEKDYKLINIELFNIFSLLIHHSMNESHSGLTLNLNIFRLSLDYNHTDIREYDYDNHKYFENGVNIIISANLPKIKAEAKLGGPGSIKK